MVNLRSGKVILAMLAMLVIHPPIAAQNYSHLDTVSVYPNKGTFYHDRFEGRKTASGEIFDQNRFTAAHWRIKLGTYILVTNQNTGLQVIVKVNDRCPKRGVIDLTHRAAAAIGIKGCQPVTVRILPPGYEEQCAAQDGMFDSVRTSRPALPKTVKPVPQSVARAFDNVQPKQATIGGYNIQLATTASHGEAFTLSQRLPDHYRDKVSIDSLEGSDMLRMTLEIHQTRQKADQLRRSLKDIFPQARVVVAD